MQRVTPPNRNHSWLHTDKLCLLFDLDGTLTNSDHLHLTAFNRLLGEYGRSISRADYVKNIMGADNASICRHLFPDLRSTFVALRTAQALSNLVGGVTSIDLTVRDVYAAETIKQAVQAATGVQADSWIKTNAQIFTAVNAQQTSNTIVRNWGKFPGGGGESGGSNCDSSSAWRFFHSLIRWQVYRRPI